ncbi:MAG: hypothetical protein ACOZQL_34110 [Myxococcota bacterium]
MRVWGGVTLAVVYLLLSAWLAPGWGFAKYPHLADALRAGTVTAAQVGDASPAYLVLNLLAPPLALRWVQAMIGAAVVAALFAFLHERVGRVGAWLGAAALALSQPWLVYAAVLEPELFLGGSVIGALLLAERGLRTPRAAIAAGLFAGFAAALRPSWLLLSVALVAVQLVRRQRRGAVQLLVAAAVAFLTPSLALQRYAGHDLRGTMSAGQVFHQSHRPESLGFGATFPSLLKVLEAEASAGEHPPDFAHELYRELARVEEPSLSDAAAEWWWFHKAMGFLTAYPVHAVGQLAQKLLFALVPPLEEYDIHWVHQLQERGWWLVPLRWLSLLGVAALTALLLEGRRPLLALAWLTSLAAALLFYAHGRYLVAELPALCGLVGLASGLERRRRLFVAAWPLLLLLAPAVRWSDEMTRRFAVLDVGGRPRELEAARAQYLAEQVAVPDVFWPTAARGAGLGADDPQQLRAAAERAEAEASTAVGATLAAGLWAEVDCQRALALVTPALDSGFAWSLGDRAIDPRLIASDCTLARGDRALALSLLEAANRERPGRLDVLSRLVAAGDTGGATDVARWEHELFLFHDAASARFALARARRRWGDPEGGRADADWLAAHWPRAAALAAHERALCLLDEGKEEEAARAWLESLSVRAALHGEHRFDGLARQLGTDPRVRAFWRRRGHPG